MSDWKTYRIGEVGKIITGKTPPTADADNFGNIYPFITPRDMVGQKNILKTERYLSEKGKNLLKNSLLPEKSICVSCIGSDLGKVVMTTKESLTNQQINSIVCHKGFDNEFIYYASVLISDSVRNIGKSSTAVPIVNKSQFSDFEIVAPELEEQQEIASILSSLDDKIELNLQMNQTLEAMAQAIFKEWFVPSTSSGQRTFNFPGFDGELVDVVNADQSVSSLPKGWKIGKLGEILELLYGKALKADTRIAGEYPVIGSSGIVDYHNEYLVEAPGIVIGRKGTIGEVIWIDENFFPIDTTFYVNDLLGAGGLYFHYFLLKDQEFKKIASDSAVPGLNRNQAMNNLVKIPDVRVIHDFNSIVQPFFLKRKENIDQIKNLTQIRDSLLPKLMTGKISLNTI